ncbi:hypothetical protein DRE_03408 [Drechslerella stenobrocha 248]|uniref:Yeast cell wall synthesis Kre9/Knh1-like N-terminal domain-containing protein n=1 Tax=Drechslerella stenobrocha 248 TaxID=1043628 RepID=W7HUT8_9PEZI|nr:hypothetical protein DRE_03408 [Drechslerella stenobrocha 248]
MLFKTFLLSTCLALLSSFAHAEYTKNAFTAPLSGDIVTAGKPFQVRWIDLDGGLINLVLVRGNPNSLQTVGAIAAGIPNTGAFNWNVPASLTAGSDYAVEIQSGAERNYTPLFRVVDDPVGNYPLPTGSAPRTYLVEKTTDAGAVLTESYPIDATSTESSIVTSTTTLIFPSRTQDSTSSSSKIITLDVTNTYSVSTVTYPTTLATVIDGSSTSYAANATTTTSSLVTPTQGNQANHLHIGAPATFAMVLAGLLVMV